MRLLLMDMLRRRKWWYLFASLYFLGAASSPSFASVGVLLSIGTMIGIYFNSREVHYLPISRRELWRTRWLLAFVPVILSMVIRILGLGIAMVMTHKTAGGTSWILPSSAFQLFYLGSLFIMNMPLSDYMPKFISPVKRLLINTVLSLAVAGLGIGIAEKVPGQWRELTVGTWLLFAIGLCLTLIGFFHSPKIAPRMMFGGPRGSSSSAGKPELTTSGKRSGRTGMSLLLWRLGLCFMISGVGCGILSQLHLIFIGWQSAGRPALIEEGATLFFSPNPILAPIPLFIPVLQTAMWTAFAPDWLRVRHMRVLPVTTQTLAAMFTLTPALFWLSFWAVLPAIYWFLAGHLPSTFRMDLLAGIAGLSCLISAASLQARVRAPGKFLLLHMLSCAGFIAVYFKGQALGYPVTSLVVVLGLAAVVVSFLLNVRAIRRNSTVYVSLVRRFPPVSQRWIMQ